MTRYPRVVEYLQDKIKKTNINRSTANAGCKILKGYCDTIPDISFLTNEAMLTIEENIHKESASSARGEASLTFTSHSIGTNIAGYLNLTLNWTQRVRLGDLFVEGFYFDKQINLSYEQTRDSCHIITLAEGNTHPTYTIKGSSLTKPEPVSKMKQLWSWKDEEPRSKSVIKGKSASDTHIIRHNKDSAWLQSINNLQQQPWIIDGRILKAIKESPIEFPETDDKDIKQRYDSKRRERQAIIAKAEELENQTFYQYMSADYRGRLYSEEPFLNFQGSDWARGMMKFGEGKPITDTGQKWLAIHTANSYNKSWDKDKIPSYFKTDYKSYLEEQELESISLDKMTLNDRIIWCNNNTDLIFDTADKTKIDKDAEKPISFLACCLEWSDFDADEKFLSRLPIPIDGSNNGWQHLGAISKDPKTSELVGLIPVEIQKDFYVQTAKELHRLTTDEERLAILSKMPMKHIRKGISKRGSMTRAYSAGAKKIAENMWLDCRTEGFDDKYGITEKLCLGFANDLVKAIDNVCPGPLDTMKYLQDLAQYEIGIRVRYKDGVNAEKDYQALRKKLNNIWTEYNKEAIKFPVRSQARVDWKENNRDWFDKIKEEEYSIREEMKTYTTEVEEGNGNSILTWITPSNFPVEYEAFQARPVTTIGTISGYDTYNAKCQVRHKGQESTDAPDINKFVCGISPNFIHSLDASHMSLVISNWSGFFGAVHDSFSTHACDVETLVEKTKHHFVKMYDCDNYFDRIRYQLTCNTDDITQPERGSLDIEDIYESDYFFA